MQTARTHNFFANGILVHNSTLYHNHLHARSLDSKHHESRSWLKALHGQIKHEIPDDWRICGENMYARHSIPYTNLESYFYVYSIWEKGRALSWDDTVAYCDVLSLSHVPVLWRGTWDEGIVRGIAEALDTNVTEGIVVRVARGFRAGEFKRVVAKWVRQGHVQTDEHWMNAAVVPNQLAPKE